MAEMEEMVMLVVAEAADILEMVEMEGKLQEQKLLQIIIAKIQKTVAAVLEVVVQVQE